MKLILLIAFFLFPTQSFAEVAIGEVTKLPLPRFASLRGDQVYARTGPATRYSIKWEYKRKNQPIEIIQEFDTWRKIRDVDGEEAWVHQSLLSGKRYAIQNSGDKISLFSRASDESRAVALVEFGAIMRLDSCENAWCSISVSGYEGYIPYDSLWGIYEGERIE